MRLFVLRDSVYESIIMLGGVVRVDSASLGSCVFLGYCFVFVSSVFSLVGVGAALLFEEGIDGVKRMRKMRISPVQTPTMPSTRGEYWNMRSLFIVK